MAAATWFVLQRELDRPLSVGAEGFTFELKPGSSFLSMVRQLKTAGVLGNVLPLQLYGRLTGVASQIKAGEYLILPGTSARQLLVMLQAGKVRMYRVTLPEGWSFRQAVEQLHEQPALGTRLRPGVSLWQQLGIDQPMHSHPEGLFFPDTYEYRRGDSDIDILVQAYRRMQCILEEEWGNRAENLPYKSPYQALIMASIVEKETGVESEREWIAGVFVRRLEKRMRLQTDPTVIYGLGDSYNNNLRSAHLKDDSNPYNTYRHGGLPPTPIALPGRAAIHASLHPSDDDALYFVAKGDGSHHFSATLEEHQAAVRHYQQQNRRSDYRSAPKAETTP